MRGQLKWGAFKHHRLIIDPDNGDDRDKRIDDGCEPL